MVPAVSFSFEIFFDFFIRQGVHASAVRRRREVFSRVDRIDVSGQHHYCQKVEQREIKSIFLCQKHEVAYELFDQQVSSVGICITAGQ